MIKHRPELPHLPADMIAEVYTALEERKDLSTHSGPEFVYEYMSATPALIEWLKANIDNNVDWAVQYFTGTIPAHSDWVFDDRKLNYLVELGEANPDTYWFDKDGKVIYTAKCNVGWYELTVNVPHSVGNVVGRRISVTHRSRRDTLASLTGLVRDERDAIKDYGFKP
jgi:hypothetical protein